MRDKTKDLNIKVIRLHLNNSKIVYSIYNLYENNAKVDKYKILT